MNTTTRTRVIDNDNFPKRTLYDEDIDFEKLNLRNKKYRLIDETKNFKENKKKVKGDRYGI